MAPRLSKNRVGGDYTRTRSSNNSDLTHCSSAMAAIMTRYSTSMEERAIVRFLVELQEIGLAPRKIRKAHVEVRSFGLPAQSTSEKPYNVRGVYARSRIPRDLVPLR